MAGPVRTCAGCGRRAPQTELVRFAAVDGRLVAGRGLPGRGVYTCRNDACFEQALARGSLSRVLRRSLVVEPGTMRIYTDADG